MSTDLLQDFGRGLSPEQLGNALAARVCSCCWPQPCMNEPDRRNRIRGDLRYFTDLRNPSTITGLEWAKAWEQFVAGRASSGPAEGPRFAVDIDLVRGPRTAVSLTWLNEKLLQGRAVASVSYVTASEPIPCEWLWPLDVGLLNDPKSRRLRERLKDVPWGDFIQIVSAESATLPIEVLMVPYSLREAMECLMRIRSLPRVELVLLLGGGGNLPDPVTMMEALRSAARADAVCVVSVPSGEQREFFGDVLCGLSHDLDFDVAITQACRKGKRLPPLCTGAAATFAQAHVSRWAASVGRQLARLPQGPRPKKLRMTNLKMAGNVGAEILRSLPQFAWRHESDEAYDVMTLGRMLREGQARPAESQRWVQASVLDLEGDTRVVGHGPLTPSHPYGLDVWIGPPSKQAIVAPEPFPEEALPPTEDGLWLTVVLTAPAVGPEAQVSQLWLPKKEASKRTRFDFTPREPTRTLESRITVLHENRVVQTLLLTVDIGDGADSEFKLGIEAVVRRNLDALNGRPRFDAAMLFNDVGSTPTMTVFAGERASMVETDENIDSYIKQIGEILENATNQPTKYGLLSSKATTRLLADLARQGSLLRQALDEMPGVRDALKDAERIQIIAAKPERVLPIEFCYNADAPGLEAKMCSRWKEALDEGICDKTPCTQDKSQVVCPVAFWATSRIIERHTYRKEDSARLGQADFALQSEPAANRSRLNVLAGSLCAAADQARANQPQVVTEAFDVIKQATQSFKEVTTWPEWEKEISDRHPSLLVLLAHTEMKGTVNSLVIGADQEVALTEIKSSHVSGNPEQHPMLLLLGCSTATHERAFQSFITQFRRAGTSIIVGTLCEILGRHAAPIAKGLTEKLFAANSLDEGTPMGNLMRKVRRELLAAGYPTVLAISAFGDADWLL